MCTRFIAVPLRRVLIGATVASNGEDDGDAIALPMLYGGLAALGVGAIVAMVPSLVSANDYQHHLPAIAVRPRRHSTRRQRPSRRPHR